MLVTGASRGIGRAASIALARAGWTVHAGVRDISALDPFDDPGIAVVELDVTVPESVETAVAACTARAPLGCLVNNAGYAVFSAIEEVDLDAARAMFDTNFFGALAVTRATLPGMRAAGGGVVVNVSSIAARITAPLFGVYYASKYALRSVSEALAMEGGPHGIRVAMIEPGMVDTGFSDAVRRIGPAARGEGPYGRLAGELVAGFRGWRAEVNTDPAEVAAAIVEAAEGRGPFHLPVGQDALRLAGIRADNDDEETLRAVIDFLGLESLRE